MKESHREGIANHSDPESCAKHREVRREALTGVQAGWVLSFESNDRERRRRQVWRKAKRTASKTRDGGRLPGVGDPRHAWKLSAREPGGPGGARSHEKAAGRKGNSKGHSLHARRREVGPLRSTGEGSEQGESLAEEPEGRRWIKENAMNEHTDRAQDREPASQGLRGVREAAHRDKGLRFTTLLHHVNEQLLLDSFYLLKKQAAPGVDRVTWS